MELKHYAYIWLLITALFGYEHWTLHHHQSISLLNLLHNKVDMFKGANISTEAGRPMSLILGWTGIGFILTTNLYVLRRRLRSLRDVGSIQGWLNFHIFCGLIGPSCIVFHSDFKVRGLVGISFWSMIIVAVSGVVGRYIYVQIVQAGQSSTRSAEHWEEKLEHMRATSGSPISDDIFSMLKKDALAFVGLPADLETASLPIVLIGSLVGDVRLFFSEPATASAMPAASRILLARYAIATRKSALLEPFRAMLGYWHSFHLPFAFFMYIAAVIHIISALMFGISSSS